MDGRDHMKQDVGSGPVLTSDDTEKLSNAFASLGQSEETIGEIEDHLPAPAGKDVESWQFSVMQSVQKARGHLQDALEEIERLLRLPEDTRRYSTADVEPEETDLNGVLSDLEAALAGETDDLVISGLRLRIEITNRTIMLAQQTRQLYRESIPRKDRDAERKARR
jgi:hypothetical protein